jgi:hypothetical protein
MSNPETPILIMIAMEFMESPHRATTSKRCSAMTVVKWESSRLVCVNDIHSATIVENLFQCLQDSGGAHFSIPARYLTASLINNHTYHDLMYVISDEFDFPQVRYPVSSKKILLGLIFIFLRTRATPASALCRLLVPSDQFTKDLLN